MNKQAVTVTFKGIECCVSLGQYGTGNVAIQLFDAEDGFPYLTASVNLPVFLPEGEVAIKDYSENEGILDILIDAGVVSKPIRYFKAEFVEFPVVKLLNQ